MDRAEAKQYIHSLIIQLKKNENVEDVKKQKKQGSAVMPTTR